MLIDSTIDRKISEAILKEHEEEKAKHQPSGKLTASMLGDPMQWIMLKVLGVSQKAFDEFTLRKFKRGKDVERWFTDFLNPVAVQKEAKYRDVIGFIDAVVDASDWEFEKLGTLPVEIKSVSSMKFRRILKSGPQRGHCLQGALYALSEGALNFAVIYVCSDDYRVQTYVMDTKDFKQEVDAVIDEFKECKKKGIVPEFSAVEDWQGNPQYNKYPEWSELDSGAIAKKLLSIKIAEK